MVAFNFRKQDAQLILSGDKCATIRPKKRCKPGDRLQLYTGMRTRKVKLLKVAECISVEQIWIFNDRIEGMEMDFEEFLEVMGLRSMTFEEFIASFAKHYGMPCTGYMVIWRDLP